MINIDDYMAANPDSEPDADIRFTTALQAVVNLKKPIFVPTKSTRRWTKKPILFETFLAISGEQAYSIGGVDRSNISALDLHGRPMFCPSTHYLDCDNVYRRLDENTDYDASYLTDPPIDADELFPLIQNQSISFENLSLENFDSYGAIVTSSSTYPLRIVNVDASCRNRGFQFQGFQMYICELNITGSTNGGVGNSASWMPIDSAVVGRYRTGTASSGDMAIINTAWDRLYKAYGLYIAGNSLIQLVRVNSCGTGIVFNGNGHVVQGVACEKNHLGASFGGYPELDVDALRRSAETLPALSTKPRKTCSGSRFTEFNFESNLRHIDMSAGLRCVFESFTLVGAQPTQLDGSNNYGAETIEYGIRNRGCNVDFIEYSGIQVSGGTEKLSISDDDVTYPAIIVNESGSNRTRNQRVDIASLTTPQKTRIRNAINAALQQDNQNEPTP